MKAKHTPGPWKVEKASGPGFNVYSKDPSEYADEDGLYVVAGDLTEGNARLVAAAPEMLAELRRMPFILSSANQYTPEQFKEIMARIDTLVAKAEGRE